MLREHDEQTIGVPAPQRYEPVTPRHELETIPWRVSGASGSHPLIGDWTRIANVSFWGMVSPSETAYRLTIHCCHEDGRQPVPTLWCSKTCAHPDQSATPRSRPRPTIKAGLRGMKRSFWVNLAQIRPQS